MSKLHGIGIADRLEEERRPRARASLRQYRYCAGWVGRHTVERQRPLHMRIFRHRVVERQLAGPLVSCTDLGAEHGQLPPGECRFHPDGLRGVREDYIGQRWHATLPSKGWEPMLSMSCRHPELCSIIGQSHHSSATILRDLLPQCTLETPSISERWRADAGTDGCADLPTDH